VTLSDYSLFKGNIAINGGGVYGAKILIKGNSSIR